MYSSENSVQSLQRIRKRKSIFNQIFRNYELYLFVLPAIVWYIMFLYVPMYGVQIAFRDYNGAFGIHGSPWVGLKHFRNFFTSYYFWPLIRNTIYLSVYSLVAGFPVPIIFALSLNEVRNLRYKKFVQTVTYMPHFISIIVLVGLIKVMINPRFGLINLVFQLIGSKTPNLLTDPAAFRHIYVISGVWQGFGWSSIIYLATLSTVDISQHESAIIDGASRLQRIWHLNIPVLIPVITILFILNAGSIMNVGFEKVLLLQNDLNLETSDVISTYVYRRGLLGGNFSFTAAIGLFNNVINFILLVFVNFTARRMGGISLF